MEDLFVAIVIFGSTVACFKIITDYKLKKKIIESGLVNEKLDSLFPNKLVSLSSLKWGLVLLGIGLAFIIGALFVPFIPDEMKNKITIGLMLGFGGIGFLIYYAIASSKESSKNKKIEK